MARTVGIIGSGHVGATLANNLLVTGSVDKLVLIDTNAVSYTHLTLPTIA